MKTLAQKLRAARDRSGLSQAGLAEASGVSLHVITKIEQAQTTDPNWSTVCKLAKALGVSLDSLRV